MDFSEGCMICLEDYSHLKIPELLPCEHSICTNCRKNLSALSKECPYCRNPFEDSQIRPNNAFIRILLQQDIQILEDIKKLFNQRLDEIVDKEIEKQQETLKSIDKIEKDMINLFCILKESVIEVINDNLIAKFNVINNLDSEIEIMQNKLFDDNAPINIDMFNNDIENIREKYAKIDSNVSMKLLKSDLIIGKLGFAISQIQESINLELEDSRMALCSSSMTIKNIINKNSLQNRRPQVYYLFDPLPGLLNVYNIEKKSVMSVNHDFIVQESTIIQLHHDTICLMTSSHLLYIDSDKPTPYYVNLTKQVVGYCLGKYMGDLMIIGGEESEQTPLNRRRVMLRQNRKKWVGHASLNIPRVFATSESIKNRIYVFGGNSDCSIEYFAYGSWHLIQTKLLNTWSNILSCNDGENIYLLGGENYQSYSNSVCKFNIETLEIREVDKIINNIRKNFDTYAVYFNNEIFYNQGDKLFSYSINN
ncbi:hypothetical protein SteCoe_7113 [Stentor coeruleus]|uniref:RING-type domain-containing protein n=1 Tax=Stentor coeruleus TaxID=5963 RepID=A0A1R2CNB9_9CILI|nr:hypothetical protein SteCoe_7113 [Stentor coeruleus]